MQSHNIQPKKWLGLLWSGVIAVIGMIQPVQGATTFTVNMTNTTFSPMSLTITQGDTNLRVGVHDRGSGIPESFRGRIFGRFTQADSASTRQKGGTGLGLAICKRLIELMQGRIGFEDRAGGGSTFWFDLPRQTD